MENISFYLSGAENLSIFQESTFDIVATRFAFHHFNDPLKVFKEVGRILNPNGIFLIIDLQGFEDEKKSKLNQIIELLHDETHILSYSLSQFINFAYHSNFTIDLHLSHLRESFTGINIEDWCNLTQHSINVTKINNILDGLSSENLYNLGYSYKKNQYLNHVKCQILVFKKNICL